MGKKRFQVGTGITSVLMIFVVLCMVSFGVLSYSTAKADLNLVNKNKNNIDSLYSAMSETEKCIYSVDKILMFSRDEILKKSDNKNEDYISMTQSGMVERTLSL